MNILFAIAGLSSFVLFSAKFIIHLYLDDIHGYRIKFSYSWMISYYMYYNKPVGEEYKKLKSRCNVILRFAFYLFILSLFVALIKGLLEKL